MAVRPVIVWFRNDLRLHDHEPLHLAVQTAQQVVPVYCIDPRQFGITSYGFQKTGRHRARFLLESLADLRTSLQKIGSNLIIRMGRPEEVLPQMAHELHATDLYYNRKIAHEEIDVEQALQERLELYRVTPHACWGNTLYHLSDLPFDIGQLPRTFTDFRTRVEAAAPLRPLYPAPHRLTSISSVSEGEMPTLQRLGFQDKPLDKRAVLSFRGGEHEGLIRLEEYIWEKDLLRHYKETRNGMLGADYSSKFSPWLSLGCLSPRYIYEQVKKYEQERVANEGTQWMVQELLWRDFFRFVALQHGTRLFQEEGIKGRDRHLPEDFGKFNSWKKGKTGVPFVDANMKELNATGFMSNRGRQVVASFLVNDLQVNWLMGAEYFESMLIDFDVASNYGNWNYVAGVGNDPRPDRYFHPLKQAQVYDPEGAYVKHWLPELALIPAEKVHQPWLLTDSEQVLYGVDLGQDYPEPMVTLA